MLEEKILTLHPEGKKGVNISRQKYDAMRSLVISILSENGEMTHKELEKRLHEKLGGSFEGSIAWYYESVKLDLEARGVIIRVPKSKPQRIKLLQER